MGEVAGLGGLLGVVQLSAQDLDERGGDEDVQLLQVHLEAVRAER